MTFRLVVERQGKRSSIEVRSSSACIGRGQGNDVRIPSAQVSRKHCELRQKAGLVTVENLESVNGTYLNGDLIPASPWPGRATRWTSARSRS